MLRTSAKECQFIRESLNLQPEELLSLLTVYQETHQKQSDCRKSNEEYN